MNLRRVRATHQPPSTHQPHNRTSHRRRICFGPFHAPYFLLFALSVVANADDSSSIADRERSLLFFNDYVKKTFEKHCFECHSHAGNKAKGGLVLDSKQGWEQGGDSGRAIEPGDAEASLLFQAVNYESGLDMPPRGKLSELEIARIREWD
jgi:hypothetical protein